MKQIFKIFLILQTVFFSKETFAQSETKTDAIFLKNGSIIYGKISEQLNNSTKIESLCKNVWAFENEEIKRIKFDTLIENESNKISISPKEKGFYWNSNLGILLESGNENGKNFSPSFQTELGYILNPYIRIGAGLGIESFDVQIIPSYFSLSVFIKNNKISPFLNFKTGYSFPASNHPKYIYYYTESFKGGFNFEISPGIKFQVSKSAELNLNIGYRYQKLTSETISDWENSILKYEYNRLAIRIGITFF
jgi:hypothetical protein